MSLMHTKQSQISAADSRTYTISELAREYGVTPRALRFYEDKDMLHPARDGMTRVYSNRDRGRLIIILRLKRLGLPLADIREILDLYVLEDGQRAQMQMSLEKFRKQVKEMEMQRDDIEMALVELNNGIDWMVDQLANEEPAQDVKRQAEAFEAVARRQLDEV